MYAQAYTYTHWVMYFIARRDISVVITWRKCKNINLCIESLVVLIKTVQPRILLWNSSYETRSLQIQLDI